MARAISLHLLLFLYTDGFIESLPIKSGFSIKLKPMLGKEEFRPKTFSTIFTKISQDFTPESILRQQIFSKIIPPPAPSLGTGCSNQVVKILVPPQHNYNATELLKTAESYSLPFIKQPFKDYKVLVVTAPPDFKIGNGANGKNVVIYVVFNEESSRDDSSEGMATIPEIYFVSKQISSGTATKGKSELNSLILVDNNRTVTGLKSQQIQKILNFRNRFIDRYKYNTIS